MGKYDQLGRFLRRRRPGAVRMSFAEVERLVGLLPKHAHSPGWWSNEPVGTGRAVQRRAWLEAGYQANLVKPELVEFTFVGRSGRPDGGPEPLGDTR